jgi:hypothetical protein
VLAGWCGRRAVLAGWCGRAAGAVLVGALCCITGLHAHSHTHRRPHAHTPARTNTETALSQRLYPDGSCHNGSIPTARLALAGAGGAAGPARRRKGALPNGSVPTALLQVAQDRRDAKERGEDVPGRAELKRMNAAKVGTVVL